LPAGSRVSLLQNEHTASRVLLVAWAPSSPTFVDLASLLSGRVVYINLLFGKRWAAPLRYLLLALKTFHVIIKARADAVFAQNPPIFCPLVILATRRFKKFRLIVDHHAVWSIKSIREPILSQAIAALERFVVNRADANITPNENWTGQFRAMGARNAFTYHDFLQKQTRANDRSQTILTRLPPHRFLVIAAHGGHPEELLEKEVAAVRELDGYLLVITGRREKIGQRLSKINLPSNVVYPGYLDQRDYESLKRQADVALSLSNEPNTVPHAVHEFLSYGVPTIVLKDDLLRSIFNGAIVETATPDTESIVDALRNVCEKPTYRSKVIQNIDNNYETRYRKHQDEILRLREALAS
jgi:UDP:flavonoid glycosyltransferase YjiC (YdhE family)